MVGAETAVLRWPAPRVDRPLAEAAAALVVAGQVQVPDLVEDDPPGGHLVGLDQPGRQHMRGEQVVQLPVGQVVGRAGVRGGEQAVHVGADPLADIVGQQAAQPDADQPGYLDPLAVQVHLGQPVPVERGDRAVDPHRIAQRLRERGGDLPVPAAAQQGERHRFGTQIGEQLEQVGGVGGLATQAFQRDPQGGGHDDRVVRRMVAGRLLQGRLVEGGQQFSPGHPGVREGGQDLQRHRQVADQVGQPVGLLRRDAPVTPAQVLDVRCSIRQPRRHTRATAPGPDGIRRPAPGRCQRRGLPAGHRADHEERFLAVDHPVGQRRVR
ncbi:MAG: hypothetical protein E6F99_03195 [Actinobacteria bacterium]|nr:MAG: hypothetical protein E6F99_03195 [Actinomycetota bacterium]